jgi:hypothetical protein
MPRGKSEAKWRDTKEAKSNGENPELTRQLTAFIPLCPVAPYLAGQTVVTSS